MDTAEKMIDNKYDRHRLKMLKLYRNVFKGKESYQKKNDYAEEEIQNEICYFG